MRALSFSAILSEGMDVEMKDASTVEVPLTFDFDFEMDDFDPAVELDSSRSTGIDGPEARSPRSPTYDGSACGFSSISPFDPDRFFKFPLVSPTQNSSPLTALTGSPAAQSHFNLKLLNPDNDSKENQHPEPPPPEVPLPWIWTCHICRSKYPLSATRRCLIDGHYYCSGQKSGTTQKNVKRKKRGQSCSSEFDYVGWQEWGCWKRKVVATRSNAVARPERVQKSRLRGCEACEYPSQCRYEKTDSVPAVVTAVLPPKTVHRGVEVGKASTRVGDGKSTMSTVKRKLLTIDTALLEVDEKAKTAHASNLEAVVTTSSDPISPDLVDFSSMVGTSLTEGHDHTSGTCVAVTVVHSVDGDSVDDCKRTFGTASTLVSKSKQAESRQKKRRSSVRESMVQSRISDFFGITR